MEDKIKIISIITPFFNEESNVKSFFDVVSQTLVKLQFIRFEVICIDDGSTDKTLDELIKIAAMDSRFQIIELSRNFGKEIALTAGLDAAIGDAVIPIDADLQDPPELIADMINEWLNGAEVVLAKRINRDSDSFFKRKSAEVFYRIHNFLSDVKIPNNVGDFRLIDRVVVDALGRIPERQRFMKGLFAWVGFKTITIEYVRQPRNAGKSKFSGWRLWNFALEGITSFSAVPLRLWTYLGISGAIFSFFFGLIIIVKTLFFGVDVPGYASLIVVILFFGSMQLISIGFLGEYIGRIYVESKNRPLYLVRKRYRND